MITKFVWPELTKITITFRTYFENKAIAILKKNVVVISTNVEMNWTINSG